ncbi:Long chain acyl-CoA synthetase 4 [Auxenochlorella protothecoides]|uniref:Long-chain-fatty-acid--CoA ligase n=1 Tax=Auxenochlorella protothecoides TaxID=3075 RepID=A0A087SFU5_AUXPR|nr:Long chain acyl-CoA synthetase 4 [Auxenochlorella protothecoides]KFM24599.1 Long chain acyl-CoA synthetase 4 [Auxenochlorella protothecoides]
MPGKKFAYLAEVGPPSPAADGRPETGPEYRVRVAKDGPPTVKDINTLSDLFSHSVSRFGDKNCLGKRTKEGYSWRTYSQTAREVAAVGSALVAAGLAPGGRVGVYGPNAPEWMITMQACNRQGFYCVPLYDTLGESAVEYIVKHAEVTAVAVLGSKLGALAASLPALRDRVRTVVYWDEADAATLRRVADLGIAVHAFHEFVALGEASPAAAATVQADDLCTIMYTSGTTGDPKGVMLSHRAVVSTVLSLDAFLTDAGVRMGTEDSLLSFLPLAHIFDRAAEELILYVGGSIGYWAGNVKELLPDVKALRPTLFCSVPRVFDRIYSTVTGQIASGGAVKKFLFHTAFNTKLARLKRGVAQDKVRCQTLWGAGACRAVYGLIACLARTPHRFSAFPWLPGAPCPTRTPPHSSTCLQAAPIWDKIVFKKIKAALGGRCRVLVSGGAPLSLHAEEFLRVCMGALVVQGYGLTETCAASFIAYPSEPDHMGTVGPPQPAISFRLEGVPEMKYSPSADPPRGEVCIRGASLFKGYYKDQEKTDEVLTRDGWFYTGDIGELSPTGGLKIIDRKKNIFKLSQGEYVAVEKVESAYKLCPSVEQIWVYGNSLESVLVAVAVPTQERLDAHGGAGDVAAKCADPELKKAILKELAAAAKEGGLKGFEQVRGVILESEPFSVENELMTPTFKLKRPQLQAKYQKEIDALYNTLRR